MAFYISMVGNKKEGKSEKRKVLSENLIEVETLI